MKNHPLVIGLGVFSVIASIFGGFMWYFNTEGWQALVKGAEAFGDMAIMPGIVTLMLLAAIYFGIKESGTQ